MVDSGLRIEVDTAFARATVEVLKRLPRDIRKNLEVELRDAAKAIAQRARFILDDEGQAPVSRTRETARLTRHRRGRGGLSYLVETKAGQDGPVGLFLEAGTQQGGRRFTQRTRRLATDRSGIAQLVVHRRSVRVGGSQRTAPHPYITRALEERSAITERSLANAVAEAIEEAAERAGG